MFSQQNNGDFNPLIFQFISDLKSLFEFDYKEKNDYFYKKNKYVKMLLTDCDNENSNNYVNENLNSNSNQINHLEENSHHNKINNKIDLTNYLSKEIIIKDTEVNIIYFIKKFI